MSLDLRRPALLTLAVSDLDRALAFWHGVLGLPIKLRGAQVAELQTDTVVVQLLRSNGRAGDDAIAWEVSDIEAARAWLLERGVDVRDVAPRGDAAILLRRVRFADPDGHALELVESP